MKVYNCDNCQNHLYFENGRCLKCKHKVGFDPQKLRFISLIPQGNNTYLNHQNHNEKFKFCENAQHSTCNWILPSESSLSFCKACALNRTIPNLSTEKNRKRWDLIENAKHRLIYSLLRMNLPVKPKVGEEKEGIAFKFVETLSPEKRIYTGHSSGTITINIEEADEKLRISNKADLGEKYRTLLGHFRHEVGHYYWDVLIKDTPRMDDFKWNFGNHRADYGKAIENHYANGAPENWQKHFISSYATAHPWEDWAETWAHYLHMMDTLETAFSFGIGLFGGKRNVNIDTDPYLIASFEHIMELWLPLTFASNSLARSMGHSDFYPFIITEPVKKKLAFIHDLCYSYRRY